MPAKWQQWMPFHIDRFKASPAVRAMHPAARAGYLYLLTCQWQSDDCSISGEPLDLAEMSELGDKLWEQFGVRILRKFEVLPNGRLRNRECFSEWEEAKRIFESRRQAAQRTNTVRSPHGDRTDSARGPSRSADTITGTVTSTEELSEAKASSPRRDAGGVLPVDPEEEIYKAYPRREGHGAAVRAIGKAVERLRKGEGGKPPITSKRDAQAYLYKRVQTYARSPSGSRADKTLIPHPATWMNQSRYLDDDAAWQLIGADRGTIHRPKLPDLTAAFTPEAVAAREKAGCKEVRPHRQTTAVRHTRLNVSSFRCFWFCAVDCRVRTCSTFTVFAVGWSDRDRVRRVAPIYRSFRRARCHRCRRICRRTSALKHSSHRRSRQLSHKHKPKRRPVLPLRLHLPPLQPPNQRPPSLIRALVRLFARLFPNRIRCRARRRGHSSVTHSLRSDYLPLHPPDLRMVWARPREGPAPRLLHRRPPQVCRLRRPRPHPVHPSVLRCRIGRHFSDPHPDQASPRDRIHSRLSCHRRRTWRVCRSCPVRRSRCPARLALCRRLFRPRPPRAVPCTSCIRFGLKIRRSCCSHRCKFTNMDVGVVRLN